MTITKGTKHWDGTQALDYSYNDGGRKDAGFKGIAGDCVTRSIAIASGVPYIDVYQALSKGMGSQSKSKGATARNGVSTGKKWFKDYMLAAGFTWTPTMLIGQGCKVHLLAGELPMGRLVVRVSRHCTSVIDGVIHDAFDPTRASIQTTNGVRSMSHRCVYGYWTFEA